MNTMLSRSASATTRATDLRRTKSTSTIHTRSSIPTHIDPTTAKQHALVAATVAYERSCEQQRTADLIRDQQAPPLRRKRSKSNRASGFEGEGSHFHEPPRRQHSSTGKNAKDPKDHHARTRGGAVSLSENHAADVAARDFAVKEVLRRMPSVREGGERAGSAFQQHRSSISVHKLRKAKSMYAPSSAASDGGARARHARVSSIEDISFAPPAYPPPLPPPLEGERTITSIAELDIENTVDITMTALPAPLTRVNLENVPDRPIELGMAPRAMTTQSLRHRASMILTPFNKRRNVTPSATPPPASSGHATPTYANMVRAPGPVAQATPRFERKRATSEVKKTGSIKAKIRNVFRRSSNPLVELPVQQVNASRQYFGQGSSFSGRNKENAASQAKVAAAPHTFLQPPTMDARGSSPTHSLMTEGTKSRVTSWAESTVAGTILEVDEEHAAECDGYGQPIVAKKADKFSSLSLLKRMRRSSKIEMRSSPPGERDTNLRPKSRASSIPSRKASGARDMLPSQIRKTTTFTKSSIRAIPIEISSDFPVSDDSTASGSVSPELRIPGSSDDTTIRGRTTVRKPSPLVAVAAEPPSPEQIANRVRKSEDRWQEPLDGGRSLFFPRSPNRVSTDRHSRASSSIVEGTVNVGEEDDVFSDGGSPPKRGRALDVVSPSVYSEDGISPNLDALAELSALPPTPMPQPGTAFVSHVARYSAGSPSKSEKEEDQQQRKTSKEWRNWLHEEVREFGSDGAEDMDLQLKTQFTPRNPRSGHRKENAQIVDGDSEDEYIGPELEGDGYGTVEVGMEHGDEGDEGGETELGAEVVRKPVPAMAWHPSQPPRLVQHLQDESVPSTTSSGHDHARVDHSLNEDEHEQRDVKSAARPSTQTSCSSRDRKLSYRYAPDDRPSSRLHNIDETTSIENRPSSRMNDRFPFMSSSRPQSRASGHASTPTPVQSLRSRTSRPVMVQKMHSAPAEKNKENMAPSPASVSALPVPARPRPGLRRPMSAAAMGMGRSTSALAQYTVNSYTGHGSPSASPPPTPQVSLLPRPVHSSPRRPATAMQNNRDVAIRKAKHISMPSLETDPTLAGILQGPYHEPLASLRSRPASSFGKENSSPLRTPKGAVTGKGSTTPTSGQRLAEQFLNARRFREEMRVMSPGEGSPVSVVGGERSEVSLGEWSPAFL